MDRCKKAIKDIYGDKVPDVKSNGLIKMAGKTSSPSGSPATQKESPVSKKESPKDEEPSVKHEELSKRFAEIKDQGNAEYKTKSFIMSASKFGEGISLF